MDLILLIVILAAIAIGVFALMWRAQTRPTRRLIFDDYTEGLRLMLAGDEKQALEKLRLAAIKDSSNIDAYLKIGDILRENGKVENAIKIHRQLTVRKGLPKEDRIDIYKCLVNDLCAINKHEAGLKVVQELLQVEKKNEWALNTQQKIYEKLDEWQKAFESKQKYLKYKNEKNDPLLAHYKVQKGLALVKKGNHSDGRVSYREALKLDDKCLPAYLYLADSYISEGRHKDALEQLMTFTEKNPEHAHLAFNRLRQLLFDMGKFSQLEKIIQQLREKNPDNSQILLALAKIHEKKGNFNEALDLSLQSLEKEPDSLLTRVRIIRYYSKLGQNDKAVQDALSWFEELGAADSQYKCSECGYQSEEPLWHCPSCANWDTFVK